ncbi:MAG: hypothetical protein UX37_C0022G0025 [Microgenomates group bacterium GW2011_GWA2_46_16]|nr:MAG: hypothetical protein UX37_C0022G0025 [Microgenomates group bacterium GW2011_GWA2_46_16]
MNEATRRESFLTDLMTLRSLAIRQHYYCEDCWYSCPKALDGCCDDSQGDECNCGADEENKKIDELYENIIKHILKKEDM